MEANRFPLTGTIVEKFDTRQFNAFFKKREFKMRFSDTEFNGKIIDRIVKMSMINDNCELLEQVNTGDVVEVRWYLDGREYEKDGQKKNFTEPVAYEIIVINSPSRTTEEDRNAVVTRNGLEYQPKAATVEDLIRAGAFTDPADSTYNDILYGPKRDVKKEIADNKTGPDKPGEFDDLPF